MKQIMVLSVCFVFNQFLKARDFSTRNLVSLSNLRRDSISSRPQILKAKDQMTVVSSALMFGTKHFLSVSKLLSNRNTQAQVLKRKFSRRTSNRWEFHLTRIFS